MKKKLFGVVIGVTTLLPSLGFGQGVDLQSLVSALQAQVVALQAQVNSLTAELSATKKNEEAPASRPVVLGRMLVRGMSGEDVRTLQEFLASQPGIYPEGLVTGYFGPLTEAAARRFQTAQGLEATGLVGTETMGKIYQVSSAPAYVPSAVVPVVSSTSPATPSPTASSSLPVTTVTSTAPVAPTSTTPATPTSTGPTPTPAMYVAPAAPAVSTPAPAAPAASPIATPTEPTAPADTTAPSVPPVLAARALSSSQIQLQWEASTDAVGVSGYKIYRDGIYLTSVTHVSYNNNHTDTGLTPGTAYSYTVAAYDAAGNLSAQTGASSATTQQLIVAPTTPSDFNLTSQDTTSISFRWVDASHNETGFTIERRYRPSGEPNEGTWAEIGSVATDATTYVDSSFPASGVYDYRVKACNNAGCSAPSNAIYTILAQKTVSAVTPSQMVSLLGALVETLRALQSAAR